MFKKLLISGIGISTLLSGIAQADVYYGGNVAFLTYSDDFFEKDASLSAVFGRVGTSFNDVLSAEARLGFGIGDDTIDESVFEVDNMYGIYARAGIPVSETFYPYAILGYTKANVTLSDSNFEASASESDMSIGIGSDINLGEKITINAEYMSYFDKNGASINGLSIGIASKF